MKTTTIKLWMNCVFVAAALVSLTTATQGAIAFSSTGSLNTARYLHTATLLPNGRVLVVAGQRYYHGLEGGDFIEVLNSAELYDPVIGFWSTTGSLSSTRVGHTATLLANGKVLVAGGSTNSTELYDPATGAWSPTGSLSKEHNNHTATLLSNGKVLVVGGYSNSVAELYNPATGAWTTTGSPGNSRVSATATLLPNGKVLVVGGADGSGGYNGLPVATAQLYDPTTGNWSFTASPAEPRWGNTATLLGNGKVLVVGGTGTNGVALGTAELFDSTTGTWSSAGNMAVAHTFHTATLLNNGHVLVTGNGVVELYDPASNAWSYAGVGPQYYGTSLYAYTATLLTNGTVLFAGGNSTWSVDAAELYDPTIPFINTRSEHTATLITNGNVLIVGGQDPDGALVPIVELDNPGTGARLTTGAIGTPRYNHTATMLTNGKVLVVGGAQAGNHTIASVETYNPATGTWSTSSNLAHARQLHTATLLTNGKVLVAGGYTVDGSTNIAELYNPATGSWSPTGNLKRSHAGHTATLLPNGKVLVTGGNVYYEADSGIAEIYDSAAGSWSLTGTLNTPRQLHTATLLNNGKVLVVGGSSLDLNTIGYLTSAELYDPATGTWSLTGSLATGRAYHTATLLPNGKVLVAGGYYYDLNISGPVASAELYDPATGIWSFSFSLSTARDFHTATLLTNGTVFITGGNVDFATGNVAGNFSELYSLSPPFLTPIVNPIKLGDGSFHFSFSNPSGPSYHVLASTDVTAPLNTWTNLGAAIEMPSGSGNFQFTDSQAPNGFQRFYHVSSP